MAARAITFVSTLIIGIIEPQSIDLAQINAALTHFSEQSLALIHRTFTPVKAAPEPIDAKAAAQVDEDLDWRIAQGRKTDEALRAFLAAHPHGAHAVEAQLNLDKVVASSDIIASSETPAPPPQPTPIAVPLIVSPAVEIFNAPPREDVFAKLEEQAPSSQPAQTIIKWKQARPRLVVEYRYARPRHYRAQAPPPNFLQALFGPHPAPRRWYMQR